MPDEQGAIEEQETEGVEVNPLDEAFPHEVPVNDEVEPRPEPGQDEITEDDETGKKEEEPGMPPEESEGKEPEKDQVEEQPEGVMAAYMAEKKKRQLLEQQLQQIQSNKPPPEDPEFDWSDPKKTIEQATQQIENKFNEKLLNMSEYSCKQRHEDYDQKYEVFVGMAMENPSLINTMLKQPDPAEWAYGQATKQAMLNDIGSDPVAYRQKLKNEILAELKAEQGTEKETEIDKKIQQAQGLPPSAAKIKAKQARRDDAVLNDPLGQVFGDR